MRCTPPGDPSPFSMAGRRLEFVTMRASRRVPLDTAEELPAAQRHAQIGVVAAASSLGRIVSRLSAAGADPLSVQPITAGGSSSITLHSEGNIVQLLQIALLPPWHFSLLQQRTSRSSTNAAAQATLLLCTSCRILSKLKHQDLRGGLAAWRLWAQAWPCTSAIQAVHWQQMRRHQLHRCHQRWWCCIYAVVLHLRRKHLCVGHASQAPSAAGHAAGRQRQDAAPTVRSTCAAPTCRLAQVLIMRSPSAAGTPFGAAVHVPKEGAPASSRC